MTRRRCNILWVILMVVGITISPGLVLAGEVRDFGQIADERTHSTETPEPLGIVQVFPANGSNQVGLDEEIGFIFNQGTNRTSVESNFGISPQVFGHLTSTCTTRYFFDPRYGLECGRTYTVSIGGGAKSALGANLTGGYSWSFSTITCASGGDDGGDDDGQQDGQDSENDGGGGSNNSGSGGGGSQNGNAAFVLGLETDNTQDNEGVYNANGERVRFLVEINNSGENTLITLPLSFEFESQYLDFVSSTPEPSNIGDGFLSWTDITIFAGDLEAGESLSVVLDFQTKALIGDFSGIARVSGVHDNNGNNLDEQEAAIFISIVGSEDEENNSEGGESTIESGASVSPGSVMGGGSGGYIPDPQVKLEYIYRAEKELDLEYLETIKLTNTGGVVLTNGELSLDLPEDKLVFVAANPTQDGWDEKNQTVSWSLPALGMDQEFVVNIVLKTVDQGQVVSRVDYISDQLSRYTASQENIVGQAVFPDQTTQKEETRGNTEGNRQSDQLSKTGLTQSLTVNKEINEDGLSSSLEIDILQQDEMSEDSGLTKNESEIESSIELSGQVAGIVIICNHVAWWVWILVIILHLIGLMVYYYHTVPEEEEERGEGVEKKIVMIKGGWGWWWRSLILLALVFVVLFWVGHIGPWWLLLGVLVVYFVSLTVIYMLIRVADKKEWLVVPLLSLILAGAPAFVCGSFAWGSWVVLGVLLLLVLSNYYYFVSLIKTRRLWALLPLWLTILVYVMEVLLSKCGC